MSSKTKNLGLLKKDPILDKNDTFNIQTMLNDNWDKLDGAVGGGFQQAKAYTDEQISLVTATGIPKLVSYPLQVTATEDKQTTFEIPLDTFEVATDTLIVVINRAFLDASQYAVKGAVRNDAGELVKRAELVLVKGVAEGSELSLLVMKNVPIGEDGAINGAVLAKGSVPIDRVSGLDEKLSDIGHSNLLKNSTGMLGFDGWERGKVGTGWSISNNAWRLGTPSSFLNYGDSGLVALLSDPIPVQAGNKYSLSAVLTSEGANEGLRILISDKKGELAIDGSVINSTEGKNDYYTPLSTSFRIPEGWTEACVLIQITDAKSTTGKYISNIMFNMGDAIPWNDDLSLSLNKGVTQTTRNISYFVDAASGSDSNDGLLSTTPFKTIKKAIELIPQLVNHSVSIFIKSRDYSNEGTINLNGYFGSGSISIYGAFPSEIGNTNSRAKILNIACQGCKNSNISLQFLETTISSNSASILVNSCSSVSVTWCTMTNTSYAGVMVGASVCSVSQSIISNQSSQAISSDTSLVLINDNTGTGNDVVLIARSGGVIYKRGTLPSGKTAEITNTGGQIRS